MFPEYKFTDEDIKRHRTDSQCLPYQKRTGPNVNFRKSCNAACRKAGFGYGYKTGKEYVGSGDIVQKVFYMSNQL